MDITKSKVGEFLWLAGGIDETHIDNLIDLVKGYIKEKNIEVKPYPIENPLNLDMDAQIRKRAALLAQWCAGEHKKCLILVEGESPSYCIVGENKYQGQEHAAAKFMTDFIVTTVRSKEDMILCHALQMAGYQLKNDVIRDRNLREQSEAVAKLAKEKGHEVVVIVNGIPITMTLDEWEKHFGNNEAA